ncbi:MAG: hypothetical protein E7639_02865 [Ruminococcaceae bacterium]|nr:hypothetical protein [Oscillospiraceae bacterium]
MSDRPSPCGFASPLCIGIAYLGCCIGAGYLSGQELVQFFLSKGPVGFLALAIATVCIFVAGAVILSLAVDSGEHRMDRIVVFFDCKPLRLLVAAFEIVFLFMVYTLCVAAFGSLISQLTGLWQICGSVAFCALSTLLALFGVRGLLRFFSYVMPVLVCVTALIALLALVTSKSLSFPKIAVGGLMTGIWVLDAVTYAVFTLFCALPVLVPLGANVRNAKTACHGALVGALLIGGLAAMIMLAIATAPEVACVAMPMLALGDQLHVVAGGVYAALLVCGIFSAGLSSQAAISEYLLQRYGAEKRVLLPVMIGISAVACCLGLLGFEELIGVLYPVFGYVGILPLILLFVHAFLFYRRRKGVKNKD